MSLSLQTRKTSSYMIMLPCMFCRFSRLIEITDINKDFNLNASLYQIYNAISSSRGIMAIDGNTLNLAIMIMFTVLSIFHGVLKLSPSLQVLPHPVLAYIHKYQHYLMTSTLLVQMYSQDEHYRLLPGPRRSSFRHMVCGLLSHSLPASFYLLMIVC